jgi:hypothetical protein
MMVELKDRCLESGLEVYVGESSGWGFEVMVEKDNAVLERTTRMKGPVEAAETMGLV